MRSRVLLALVAMGAMAVSFVPARAGQYSTQVSVLQGALGQGTLVNGAKATIVLGKLQGLDFFGPGAVIPNSGQTDLPSLYGSSVPTVTGGEGPARYAGCIEIVLKTIRDGGCAVIAPSSATFDPVLNTGSLTFSVRSRLSGYAVTATAILRATSTPVAVHSATPNHYLSQNGIPMRATAAANVSFERTASLLGSVRSDIIGGGPFRKVSTAKMFGGLGTFEVADRSMPFCMSPTGTTAKPGDMPWNEFPPKLWIPGPPTLENFDPNNPRYDPNNPPQVKLPSPPYQPTRICPKDV